VPLNGVPPVITTSALSLRFQIYATVVLSAVLNAIFWSVLGILMAAGGFVGIEVTPVMPGLGVRGVFPE
jgi:hypothetical protein